MFPQDHLLTSIRANGLRMTRQRQLILKVLQESQEHLDADALHDRLKAADPRIGLATVYRTLALLKEFGLAEEHRLGEEHGHFEAVPEKPHYHFACQGCGRVIEFDAARVMSFVQSLAKQEGVHVTEVQLFLRGYCAECEGAGNETEVRR